MERGVAEVYEFEDIIGEYVNRVATFVIVLIILFRGAFSNVVLATHNETSLQYAIKVSQY